MLRLLSHIMAQINLRNLKGSVDGKPLKEILEVHSYSWDWKVCRDMILAGRGDIAEVGSTRVAALAKLGGLVDLTDLVNELSARRIFPHRALLSCYWEGRCWAIPFVVDVRLLFYSVRAIETSGIQLSEFEEALQRGAVAFETFCSEKASGGSPPLIPFIAFAEDESRHDLLPWIWNAGGDILDEHGTVRIHENPAYEGLRRIVKCAYFNRHSLGPAPRVNDIIVALLGRKIMMMSAGFWMARTYPHRDLKVACPPPDWEFSTYFGGTHLGVVKRADNSDEPGENAEEHYSLAKECIKLLVEPTNNCQIAIETGQLPAHHEAWEQFKSLSRRDDLETTWTPDQLNDLFHNLDLAIFAANQRILPPIPETAEVEEILRRGFKTIWQKIDGCASVNDCDDVVKEQLQEMAGEIESLVGSSPVERMVFDTEAEWRDGQYKTLDRTPYDLFVDEIAREVYVGGEKLSIGRSHFNNNPLKVLCALLRAKSARLDVPELYSTVWSPETIGLRLIGQLEAAMTLIEQINLLLKPTSVLFNTMQTADDDEPAGQLEGRFTDKIGPLPTLTAFEPIHKRLKSEILEEVVNAIPPFHYVGAKRVVTGVKASVHATVNQLRDTLSEHHPDFGKRIIPDAREGYYQISPDCRVAHVVLRSQL